MKKTYPQIFDTVIKCACGATFETKSTEKEIHVGSAPTVNPFFTGKQKFLTPLEDEAISEKIWEKRKSEGII